MNVTSTKCIIIRYKTGFDEACLEGSVLRNVLANVRAYANTRAHVAKLFWIPSFL